MCYVIRLVSLFLLTSISLVLVETLPILETPLLDQKIQVNESFQKVIPVDLFKSDLHYPIKYEIISTGHDWISSYELEPEITDSIFNTNGLSRFFYRDNDLVVIQDSFSIKMFNVSDPFYLRLVSSFEGSDLDGDVFAYGDSNGYFVFLALDAGLIQKYDFSDYDNPVEDGAIDLSGVTALNGKDGILYVLSQDKLFCVDMNTMEELGSVMIQEGGDGANKMILEGNIVYCAGLFSACISAINVTDPSDPFIADSLLIDDLVAVNRLRALDKLDDIIYFTGSYLSLDEHFFMAINISAGLSQAELIRTYDLPHEDDDTISMVVASHDLAFIKVYLDTLDDPPHIRALNISVDPPEVIYDIQADEKYGDVDTLKVGERLGGFGPGEVLFFCDEESGFKVFDVRNLSGMSEMIGWSDCRQSINMLDVEIDGDKSVAYVSSKSTFGNSGEGLRVVDISRPEYMTQMGFYSTKVGNSRRYTISSKYDVLYICHVSEGVKVLDIRLPYHMTLLSKIPAREYNDNGTIVDMKCQDVGLNEDEDLLFVLFGYLWNKPGFVQVYNVSDSQNPFFVGGTELGTGTKYGIKVMPDGNHFYVFEGDVVLWNSENLTDIFEEVDKNTVGSTRDGALYTSSSYDGLDNFTSLIVAAVDNMDILNLDNLLRIPLSVPDTASSQKVVVGGRYAFLSSSDTGGGVMIVDIKNISSPVVIYEDTTGDTNGVSYLGNYVFLPDEQVDGFHSLKFNEIGISGSSTECGNYEVVIQADDDDGIATTSFFVQVRKEGFYDDYCTVYMCPGEILSNDTSGSLCSGNGECDPITRECECDDGYYGFTCLGFTCNDLEYTNVEVVCQGRGECVGLDECLCDSTEDEVYEYIGVDCEIRIGRQIVRATKSLLMVFFEITIENLKNNYDLEVDESFDCARFIEIENIPLRNCSLSSMYEFFEFAVSTQFLKIQVGHLTDDEYLELLKIIEGESTGDGNEISIYSTFSNHTKSYQGKVYPMRDDLLEFRDIYYTMKSFSQGVVSDDDKNEPIKETQFCKQRLFIGEDCIQFYQCYESLFDEYSHYSVGFVPSTELDKEYFGFSKFYFPDEESCLSGAEITNFKTFAAVSCYGSSYGDNFFMYSKCSEQLFSIFFDPQIMTIFVITASPMYVLLILLVVLVICCFFNSGLYCGRYLLKKSKIYKSICPWYYGKKYPWSSKKKNDDDNDDDSKKKNMELEEEMKTLSVEEEDEDDEDNPSERNEESSVMSEVTRSYVKSPSSEQLLKGRKSIDFSDAYISDGEEDVQIINQEEESEEEESPIPALPYLQPPPPLRNVSSVDVSMLGRVSPERTTENECEEEDSSGSGDSGGQCNEIDEKSGLSSTYSSASNATSHSEISQDEIANRVLLSHFSDHVSETQREYQSIMSKVRDGTFTDEEALQELCDVFSTLSSRNLTKISESGRSISNYPTMPSTLDIMTRERKDTMFYFKMIKKIETEKMKKNKKGVWVFRGKNRSKGRFCEYLNTKCEKSNFLTDLFCFCCHHCCMDDLLKSLLFIFFMLLKDGLALWFSSSEFLSNSDIDRSNKDFIILTTVLSVCQYIIWISIFTYITSLFIFILVYVERFMFDPLMFCVSYGSLREFVLFRIFKAVFLFWFICVNLFCYMTKFWYLDSFEKKNELVSPFFYLSILLPEGLLIFKLISDLNYNGVSSFSMYKRMKNLGIRGLWKFPKANISYFRTAVDCDVILEDFFQLLFIMDLRIGENENMNKIVQDLSSSEEYGHLSWEYLRGMSIEEMMYLRKFFFPKEIEDEDYCSVFKYHKITSPKWNLAICIFPFLCCVGSNIL